MAKARRKPAKAGKGGGSGRAKEIDAKGLNIPKLNTSGEPQTAIRGGRGGKKGKKFIEDPDVMLRILAQVNDAKDGTIKSKLQRAHELERIREAKRKEQEVRDSHRQQALADAKAKLVRKKRPARPAGGDAARPADAPRKKKSVSFA